MFLERDVAGSADGKPLDNYLVTRQPLPERTGFRDFIASLPESLPSTLNTPVPAVIMTIELPDR